MPTFIMVENVSFHVTKIDNTLFSQKNFEKSHERSQMNLEVSLNRIMINCFHIFRGAEGLFAEHIIYQLPDTTQSIRL